MDKVTVDQTLSLAIEHHQAGRLAEGMALYRGVLKSVPNHARTLQLLGVAEHQSGLHQEAIGLLERSIQIDAHQADAYFNLGCVLATIGHQDQSVAAYNQSLSIDSNQAPVHINLGNVLKKIGELNQALGHYQEAHRIAPDSALPHFLAGVVLEQLDRVDEAVFHYEKAIEIDPSNARAHNNLGAVWHNKDTSRAIENYRRALVAMPGHDSARTNLAMALSLRGLNNLDEGLYEKSIVDIDAAQAVKPSDALRVRRAMALPIINPSAERILLQRRRFQDDLATLARDGIGIEDPIREINATPFFLAYHGLNDRELLESLAGMYRQTLPALTFSTARPPKRQRLRVGFVSRHLHRHTISSFMEGWIRDLDRKRFEVIVAKVSPTKTDEVSARIDQAADRCVEVPNDLLQSQQRIASLQCDVLIYPDIGMEPVTYFLAFARLAPVQCAWWGHPTTTGINTIDYYLSCCDLEPDAAESHYSETLVQFASLAMYTPKPTLPSNAKTRRDFGFGANVHLYVCPQSLFKLHPEFDARLGKLLRADPDGRVVFFEGRRSGWTQLLRDRLKRVLGSVYDRVVFLPRQPFSAFLGLVATADVVLDSLHFNGGNTTYQALALGTPVVTQPGAMARSRITLACYRQMGMDDLVADGQDAYVDLAVRLGTNASFRQAIRQKILQKHDCLFDNRFSVNELEDFIERVVAAAPHSMG